MLNELLELVDSKIGKVQYAVQNGVPYADSLSDLQDIRTAIMKLKDAHNNEPHSTSVPRDENQTPDREDS